jgi:Asp-tRNA(Asn)/Glu-tRNA(Gln) amidotransferase A subunit family amidase
MKPNSDPATEAAKNVLNDPLAFGAMLSPVFSDRRQGIQDVANAIRKAYADTEVQAVNYQKLLGVFGDHEFTPTTVEQCEKIWNAMRARAARAETLEQELRSLIEKAWKALDSDIEYTEPQRSAINNDMWQAIENAQKLLTEIRPTKTLPIRS